MLVTNLAEHIRICVFGICISFGKWVARISNRIKSLFISILGHCPDWLLELW